MTSALRMAYADRWHVERDVSFEKGEPVTSTDWVVGPRTMYGNVVCMVRTRQETVAREVARLHNEDIDRREAERALLRAIHSGDPGSGDTAEFVPTNGQIDEAVIDGIADDIADAAAHFKIRSLPESGRVA